MLCHKMGLLRLEFGHLPGLLGEKLFEKLANDPAPDTKPGFGPGVEVGQFGD